MKRARMQEQRRRGGVGFGGSRGSAGVWRIGWLRRPASDSRAQHIRVLLAPYPRTAASFGALRVWLRSWSGFRACLRSFRLDRSSRAGLAPLPLAFVGQKQRGKPRSTKARFPGFVLIEATTPTFAEDVVPWGSGASRPGMACGRSSEPWTAEPSDAPDPQGAAALAEADALASSPIDTAAPTEAGAFQLSVPTKYRVAAPGAHPAPG